MAFLDVSTIDLINEGLVSTETELKKVYKSKKSHYYHRSIPHSDLEKFIDDGWEIERELKYKTRILREKPYDIQFQDDVWCQFYELGYRKLNVGNTLTLPFGRNKEDTKKVDVVAMDDDIAFIVECKSSLKPKPARSYKDKFDLINHRLPGFVKSLKQLCGRNIKVKYIFATRNIRLSPNGEDLKRLETSSVFYYGDNTYDYINSLIKHYKNAAHYQFLGMVFKNEKINDEKIELPAIEGKMGNKTYYMCSIEPHTLLKLGFILHKTKANENEAPTYQRLLVPSRLKGITQFIDEGGYFPNSIIINFDKSRNLQFQSSSKKGSSISRFGTLKIPNQYAIAYIIDGQHRLYGYANSKYRYSNTVPIVALVGLDSVEQLSIFMDINQNQKAVSPSLRLVLEEDLYWNSSRVDSRLKALRSSIAKALSVNQGPLFNKISVGEDTSLLAFKPFTYALLKSGLLPTAKGNKYDESSVKTCLYNINNDNHSHEMEKSRKHIVALLNLCYEYVEQNYPDVFEREKYFIISNRGTFAFIVLIGSLNMHLINGGVVTATTLVKLRFEAMKKYLRALLDSIRSLSQPDVEQQLMLLGSGADVKWLRFFQTLINKIYEEYEPDELIDWKERQDEALQNQGRTYGIAIEKYIKKEVLSTIQKIYGDNWELEIATIKRECTNRALQEMEKRYKEGLPKINIDWKEMFTIVDYKSIIEKHWTKRPENNKNFTTFEKRFSIDIGDGFNSKSEKTKWLSLFNSHRNLWAHEGTKDSTLNSDEVLFLSNIYVHFYN